MVDLDGSQTSTMFSYIPGVNRLGAMTAYSSDSTAVPSKFDLFCIKSWNINLCSGYIKIKVCFCFFFQTDFFQRKVSFSILRAKL